MVGRKKRKGGTPSIHCVHRSSHSAIGGSTTSRVLALWRFFAMGKSKTNAHQPTHSIATTTMKLLASISALLPKLHAFLDEDSFYQLGATWTAADGLREQHNLELRYTHNSERLALQGQPMPNGSWRYVAPNGRVHTISADRARDFMETTHRHATVMVGMLDRLKEAGVIAPTFDTQQAP